MPEPSSAILGGFGLLNQMMADMVEEQRDKIYEPLVIARGYDKAVVAALVCREK